MEKKKIKAGIVGSGFSASFHFASMMKVAGTDVEVTGVYSRTKENREKFANQRNIKAYDDLDTLIEDSDVIHICVPPYFHEEVAVKALEKNTFPIIEKPLTGYFGDGSSDFHGDTFPKHVALDHALESVQRFLEAEEKSDARILYAENWVYAPAIQKEREILEKTDAQILWMHGEEAHSGSHAKTYAYWKYSGGGVMIGKGCHPLTAALYLKRVEGRKRNGIPIRPKTVTARVHAITRSEKFIDKGHIRSDYYDIDDFSLMHVQFEDGTIADIFASDIVLGGIHNWIEVACNNHRTTCNINPNTIMQTFNPVDAYFKDVYVVEKTETKQGWSNPQPDEDWITGYPEELEAFYKTVTEGTDPESDSSLAADAIATIYSAYVSTEKNGTEIEIKTF